MSDPEPCDGIAHAWRILLPEETAERCLGETRSVAVARCCGVGAYWDGVEWRVG